VISDSHPTTGDDGGRSLIAIDAVGRSKNRRCTLTTGPCGVAAKDPTPSRCDDGQMWPSDLVADQPRSPLPREPAWQAVTAAAPGYPITEHNP
jgi:hypothetical protein